MIIKSKNYKDLNKKVNKENRLNWEKVNKTD